MSRMLRDMAWVTVPVLVPVGLSPQAALLFLAVCERVGPSGLLFASEETVAGWVGCSRSWVRRYKAELVEWELLELVKKPRPGRNATYQLFPSATNGAHTLSTIKTQLNVWVASGHTSEHQTGHTSEHLKRKVTRKNRAGASVGGGEASSVACNQHAWEGVSTGSNLLKCADCGSNAWRRKDGSVGGVEDPT